ncbi:cobalamin-independent methionine synthase II family protein, partial [Acidobacteria bacterium AH-259-A15]|nr:cobalamin-independent methionine synthase II family protein [Acidobacteria bacterium AH-259-A15]
MRTEKTQKLPPFYTQVIGSLPRPKVLLDLHARRSEMSQDRFNAVMNEMVVFAIRLQEQAGLDVISDGEWRRVHYVDEFLQRIGGFKKIRPFEHAGERKYHLVATGKMQANEPVFVNDARFLVKHTDRVTKFALPSPFLVGIRYWQEDFSKDAYPTAQHFMEHLTEILASECKALEQAGIDIIQLDDPALTYFCDRKLTDMGQTHDDRLRRRWDADKQIPEAVGYINTILEGLNAEVHLHCCHSVYKRKSDVTGNYEPLLPHLVNAKIDRVNLEFAYKDTGDVSDLKLLPDGMGVGMGVVDVRGERIQEIDEIESIGAAGAEVVNPDRIAVNPDCGFAPDMGEPPSIDEAFEKLCRLSTAAKRLRQRF